MANCEGGFDERAQQCLGTWVTYRSCIGLDAAGEPCDSDGIRKVVPQTTIDAWMAHPQFLLDVIDDLGNLTLNYFITVGDNSKWPTPNQFVARFTPIPVAAAPVEPPPSATNVDVAIQAVNIPNVRLGGTGDIAVSFNNTLPGAASGTLKVEVKDQAGKLLNTYSAGFTTTTTSKTSTLKFSWTAPSYKTVVTVTATATATGDIDPANNTMSATKEIK